MRRIAAVIAVIGGLVALALALGSLAQAQESQDVTLAELDGSGITGSATLTSSADGSQTTIEMIGNGLDIGGSPHLNHIHVGTGCGTGEYTAAPQATLTELADADEDGSDTQSTVVTEADDATPLTYADIADGGHVLVIHGLEAAPAACGVIASAQAGPTSVGPTATAAATALPPSGFGGPDNDGSGTPAWLLAVLAGGALAMIAGFAALGLRPRA